MRSKTWTPFIASLLAACAADTNQLPESTTTTVTPNGGMAVSADGLFSLHFTYGAVLGDTEISIATIRDIADEDLLSLVYSASPKDLVFAKPVEAQYRIDADPPPEAAYLAAYDALEARELTDSQWVPDEQVFRGLVTDLQSRNFGLLSAIPIGCGCDDCCRGNGFEDAPGSGATFIVNQIAVAAPDVGFDIDGRCDDSGCSDNSLGEFLGRFNDQMRQSLLGGELLQMVELAGLADPYAGRDPEVTVKLYQVRDADDPFFPANNFKVPPGHSSCCEFLLDSQSLEGVPPQSRSRIPAVVSRNHLRTSGSPGPIAVPRWLLTLPAFNGGAPVLPVALDRPRVSMQIARDGSELEEILLGGVFSMRTLAELPNLWCETPSPMCGYTGGGATMLDVIAHRVSYQADMDLDGDGLECVYDLDGDGNIDTCRDGPGEAQPGLCGEIVPPTDYSRPWTCVLQPEMADGWSVAYRMQAVRASVVGVGR